ncbi:MAG: hypothetical protein ACTSQF_02245 [Candidatus Heimdallarchaeaceae archaeon]
MNPHTLRKWFMDGSYELVEGKPGQPGAKTIIRQTQYNRSGSYTTESIHTVIKNDLPYEYVSSLESKGVKMTSYSYFQEEAMNVTRWISRNEVELSRAAKMISFISKRVIRSQSRLVMKRFKKHAERAYAHEK